MKNKLKVLLLNLPRPALNLNRFRDRCENISLACGYLKAYVLTSDIKEEVTIDIAPQPLMSMGGDLGIISFISEKNYDIVGFSLYQWNALRSLHIMRETKKRNPKIMFLAGGPEVSHRTEYLMNEKVLDFMIEGEGEEPFRMLLSFLRGKAFALEEIPGLIYKDKKYQKYNLPPKALGDISKIPSPYLLNIIEPGINRVLHLETMRGCIHNCKYCSWKQGGRQGVSFFPLERIRQEILFAREKGIHTLRLVDASSNVCKEWLKSLCKVISSENRDHFLEIRSFLHPELIDEESALWLAEANFKNPIVGFQSTNPEVLKKMGRITNFDDYLRGTSLLREKKIGFVSTIILGLPRDTIAGFKNTMKFLLKNNHRRVICFPLSVSPNTQFRNEADSLGIKFQKMPPNLVISTPTMNFEDLRTCIRLFRKNFSQLIETHISNKTIHYVGSKTLPEDGIFEKDIHYLGRMNYAVDHPLHWEAFPSLTTFIEGKYPGKVKKKSHGKPLEEVLSLNFHFPLTKIIFSKDCRVSENEKLERMVCLLTPRLAWYTLLWLQDFRSKEDIQFLQRIITLISQENPFHIWNIVLEFERETPLDFLSEITSSVNSRPGMLDYESLYEQKKPQKQYMKIGPLIYAVVPYGRTEFSKRWLTRLSKRIPLFWSLTLPTIMKKTPDIYSGYLIDFPREHLPSQILYTLSTIKNSKDCRPCFFKNWVIQRVWSILCMGQVPIWGADENILEITDDCKGILTTFSDKLLRKHMNNWIRSRK